MGRGGERDTQNKCVKPVSLKRMARMREWGKNKWKEVALSSFHSSSFPFPLMRGRKWGLRGGNTRRSELTRATPSGDLPAPFFLEQLLNRLKFPLSSTLESTHVCGEEPAHNRFVDIPLRRISRNSCLHAYFPGMPSGEI